MIRRRGLAPALEDGDASWDDVDRSVDAASWPRCCASTTVLGRPAPGPRRARLRPSTGRWPGRRPPSPIVLLRNEPVDGERRCSRSTPRRCAGSRSSAGWPTRCNLGDGGSSDVWAPEVVTPLDGLRAALPDADGDARRRSRRRRGRVAAGRRRRRRRRRLHAATTRASTSATTAPATSPTLFPGPDDPELAARVRRRPVAADPRSEPPAHVGRAATAWASPPAAIASRSGCTTSTWR